MPELIIADDSMFQRFTLAKLASAAGFDVVQAKDGEECLALVREGNPVGVVLDMNMPGLNGLDVLRALAEDAPDLPVIVLTSDIQDSTRRRCLDLGAGAVLHKPVDEAAFHQELQALLS